MQHQTSILQWRLMSNLEVDERLAAAARGLTAENYRLRVSMFEAAIGAGFEDVAAARALGLLRGLAALRQAGVSRSDEVEIIGHLFRLAQRFGEQPVAEVA